jgi:acetylornithine deacetylase/succinyl-diaminopimelate desuccinylase-like protein
VSDVLRATLAGRREAIIELACRLVAIRSDSPAHDEREVVATLQAAAESLGLPGSEIHAAIPERPNLLLRLRGPRPGPAILLNGHVDTKPAGDPALWPADPWQPVLHDGSLHGLGAADMKGAVAAMLHAAAALHDHGLPARGELLLALTADEEGDGELGLAALMPRTGLRIDAALIGEPCGRERSFDTLPLGSRGFLGFTLVARGERIHSALSDRMARRSAIGALARAVDRLPAAVDFGGPWPEPFAAGPTLSVATSLDAGVAPGVVPGTATAAGDVRTVPGQSRASVIAALEAGIGRVRAEAGGDLDVVVRADPEDWPATSIDPSLPLVRALATATNRVTGTPPMPGVFPGATEAHVLDRLGVPCVPAFGPGLLRSAHVPAESIRVDDIVAAAEIYALAVADLLG